MSVRVSLSLFGLPPSAYAPVAIRAEECGFDTLWLADHLVVPLEFEPNYPYSPGGRPGFEPDTPLVDVIVAAGHVGAVTERLRIGFGVYVLPLREPIAVARAVGSAQALTGGRILFGVGVGWMREEFDAVGAQFEHRGSRMEEMLEILDALWTGEPTEHAGRFYRFAKMQLAPGVPRPPLFMGGATEVAIKRTARLADGWYGPACSLEESLAARDRVETWRAEYGRQGPFEYAVRIDGPLAPETLSTFEDVGFDHVVISFAALGPEPGNEQAAVERCAEALGL